MPALIASSRLHVVSQTVGVKYQTASRIEKQITFIRIDLENNPFDDLAGILVTDGRANIPLGGGDPAQEALEIIARQLDCRGFVIDTENSEQHLGNAQKLAEAFGAHYMALEDLERIEDIAIEVERLAGSFPKM